MRKTNNELLDWVGAYIPHKNHSVDDPLQNHLYFAAQNGKIVKAWSTCGAALHRIVFPHQEARDLMRMKIHRDNVPALAPYFGREKSLSDRGKVLWEPDLEPLDFDAVTPTPKYHCPATVQSLFSHANEATQKTGGVLYNYFPCPKRDTIAINPAFVRAAINSPLLREGATVGLGWNDPAPWRMDYKTDDYRMTAVIMPVKINDHMGGER